MVEKTFIERLTEDALAQGFEAPQPHTEMSRQKRRMIKDVLWAQLAGRQGYGKGMRAAQEIRRRAAIGEAKA